MNGHTPGRPTTKAGRAISSVRPPTVEGANGGPVSPTVRCRAAARSTTNPHRRRASNPLRSPGIQRCAGRRHAPTNPHEACPEALEGPVLRALEGGPPPPPAPASKNTLTRPHCPNAVPSPTLLPCTTRASTPATSQRPRECRSNLRKTRRKTPKTHSFRTKTSRICRGQFCRRLVSHIAKSPLERIEVSTAEEPPGGWYGSLPATQSVTNLKQIRCGAALR